MYPFDFVPKSKGGLTLKRSVCTITLILVCNSSATQAAEYTRWRYEGSVMPASTNDLRFPVPVGEDVIVNIVFDPLTPDSNVNAGGGDYLMSGGETLFQVQIGSHISAPITRFRITTIVEGCCGADDQYNFLSYQSQGDQMRTEFPGYLEGDVTTQLFFFERLHPGPITSDALPTQQPNPADFVNARLAILKNAWQTNNRLIFHANLRPILVPEPASMVLICSGVVLGLWKVRTWKDKDSPK